MNRWPRATERTGALLAPARSPLLGLAVAVMLLVMGVASRPAANERLLAYRLGLDAPVDASLQESLEAIDRRLGAALGMAEPERACGVLDLSDLRLALVRPDAMFYGASVPKVCIVLGYFASQPGAAADLDPAVQRELELVIKRSSNELAAKYSQLVGLETIQKLQTSERYRLYDPNRGGGLWCGKHYGIDKPRSGDPLGDFSHAATVRQCLRFYLMMEQGRLVSPAASRKMREIFAAPELEFHDSGFVAGLRGRDLTLIRKSGLWEDWHLDTARIEHGCRVYLLAAMTHHARGDEYLRRLAAAVDDLLCGPSPPKPHRHELHRFERPVVLEARETASDAGPVAEHTSPPVVPAAPFNEALVSWNVSVPDGFSFTVEFRVGRRHDDSWSPWLHVGDWNRLPDGVPRTTEFDEGRVDVDYFRSAARFDRARYRLRFHHVDGHVDAQVDGRVDGGAVPGKGTGALRIARVAICFSDTSGLPESVHRPVKGDASPPPAGWQRRLPVPFRSQRSAEPSIAGRICSPTSLAMVLAYRGVERPTLDVARAAYDAAHDIYGNWPRAVQAAYSFGVPGYLTRFADWSSVERSIAAGQPLIVSIRVKKGQLSGAPYTATNGHLLVLSGFDADGNVLVNDPAAASAEKGLLAYRRDELETIWFARGGTAYVLLPRD